MASEDKSYPVTTDPVLNEARERFRYCEQWESTARKHAQDDYKFANGDSYNMYQWPNGIQKSRDSDEKPTLTLNQVQQHNLQIINDAKQNKTAIQIRATGGEATFESAQIFTQVVRHIEYASRASVAYSTAIEFQVQVGIGYWYYELDYEEDDSFDLAIKTKRCIRPDLIYIDPDIAELDGSDAEYGFIFEDVYRKEFNRRYPKWKDKGGLAALGNTDWYTSDKIRVADYYRVIYSPDKLYAYADPDNEGRMLVAKKSELGSVIAAGVEDHPQTRSRDIQRREIEWNFIVGNEIVQTKIWPGRYIPIVRLVGIETVIDGVMDRRGHTRSMIDPQRMYNYWSSSAVENVALQSKTPYIGAAEAFEGFEEYWKTANKVNHAFLPFNGFADDGQTKIEAPQRQSPPVMAQAYIDGMKVAQQELMMVSGQWQAQMGQQGNERSAKAINERQRQGDNATYHFIDNLSVALCHAGRIILDLIPHVYDTRRIMKIMGEDGELMQVTMDPQAKQSLIELQDRQGKTIERILNPRRGKYDVVADIGPAYATRRQETFNAMVQIMTQAPQLTPFVADLFLKSADFPDADEGARRLRRMVPPQALGDGPTPQEQALQQQVQQLESVLAQVMQDAAGQKLKLQGKEQLRDINAYDAETKRMAALAKMFPEADPKGLKDIIHQLVVESLRTTLLPVIAANQDELASQARTNNEAPTGGANGSAAGQPPVPGARQAPDGNWYVADEGRPGKYKMIQSGSMSPLAPNA